MKIVLLDDEPIALRRLQSVVSAVCPSSEICSFTSAEDALEHINKYVCDIAFLDLEMPDEHGLVLAKKIKNVSPKIKIVFVTGYAEYALEAYSVPAGGYILKPPTESAVKKVIEELQNSLPPSKVRIRVQTFGNFEIFINDMPISFARAKAKELLAYLVFRRGATATTSEVAAILWEDKIYDRSLQRQTQTVISSMMHSLKVLDAAHIVNRRWNNLSINTSELKCDYYDYLNMNVNPSNSHCGTFMSQYSWAEAINADLSKFRPSI